MLYFTFSHIYVHIFALIQDCSISIANTLQILQSFFKPSISDFSMYTCIHLVSKTAGMKVSPGQMYCFLLSYLYSSHFHSNKIPPIVLRTEEMGIIFTLHLESCSHELLVFLVRLKIHWRNSNHAYISPFYHMNTNLFVFDGNIYLMIIISVLTKFNWSLFLSIYRMISHHWFR